MTGRDAPPPKSPKDAREARLAAALRENLKRRKAQIRGKVKTGDSRDAGQNGGQDAGQEPGETA